MSVSFLSMSALGAALAGVFRVNPNHIHAKVLRLVADKLFKLIEGPAVQIRALFLSESPPVADTAKVFDRNRRVAGVLGELNDAATDAVVLVPHKAPLSPRQPFQGTPRGAAARLCLFPLERSAGFGVVVADMIGMPAAKEALAFAVGDGGQHVNAPVYAYHGIVGFGNRFDLSLEGDRKKNIPFANKEPGIAELPVREIVGELGFAVEGNAFDPACKGPHAQALTGEAEVPATFSSLQGDSTVLKDDRLLQGLLGGACGGVFGRDLPDRILRDLGRETKAVADFLINTRFSSF
jgi:hypothetical protein